jgi:Ca-activated chloride channel family protein
LQKQGIFLKPFVIGIGMDNDFESQFGCMGSFYDAANIRAFKNALNKALFQSLEATTVSIELLDETGKGTETNVNVSLINHFTQIPAFEFVHFRDAAGRPDSVEIDPVLTYDVVVNTIPPVRREKINLRAGTHNVIEISSPQGYLQISQQGTTEYENGVLALIREPGMPDILTTMNLPSSEKLLVGQYEVVLTTLPRKTFQRVEVRQGQTTKLALEQPGVVNFVATSRGFASIYEILEDGSQRWIYNLNPQILRTTLAIQPGSYKIVFRAESAKGSKYTSIQDFEVDPGSSLNMRL